MYYRYNLLRLLSNQKQDSSCCQYGKTGKGTVGGGDCLLLPGAEKKAGTAVKAQCMGGGQKGLVTVSGTTAATVCCKYLYLTVCLSRIESPQQLQACIDTKKMSKGN